MKTLSNPENKLRRANKVLAAPQLENSIGSQAGLTLIECLVAIVIVALVGAIIAPAMVLSVATRVQSQRATQALDIAQSEIDTVRLLIESTNDYADDDLPQVIPDDTLTDERRLATVLGPQELTANEDAVDSWDQAFPVDIDSNEEPDFAVQRFRTPGEVSDGQTVAFIMGVRVYDIDALDGINDNLPTVPASLAMTTGEGERLERPLAVLYSSIALSEDGRAFCNYINYLSTTTSTTPSTPSDCL